MTVGYGSFDNKFELFYLLKKEFWLLASLIKIFFMKLFIYSRVIFLAFLFLNTYAVNATVWTVCNNPSNVAQFNEIDAAITSPLVNAGDTLLVQGSPTMYANFDVDKKLTIIGPGLSQDRNGVAANALTAKVQQVKLLIGCDGTELQGLDFQVGNSLILDVNNNISNIKILRNHIPTSIEIGYFAPAFVAYTNFVIESNWFDNGEIICNPYCSYSNFLIQNNVFFKSYIKYFTNSVNIIINHNLFYAGGNAGTYTPFLTTNSYSQCLYYNFYNENLTIQNNVFYNANLLATYVNSCGTQYSLSHCTFINNLLYRSTTAVPWAVNNNTNGGGNINNSSISPKLVAEANVLNGESNPLLDFSITNTSSPAFGTASDSKNMGLLFDPIGSLNWKNCRNSRIPYIYNFNITNPNVGPSKQIKINLEARRSN